MNAGLEPDGYSSSDSRGQADDPPVVAISSSMDETMGSLRAPLNGDLSLQQVAAVVWRALDLDTSARNLRAIIKPDSWVVVKPNIVTSRGTPGSLYWDRGVPHRGQNTDLRAIVAIVDYILKHCQPRRVSIAEGGAEWRRLGEPDTEPQATEDGWTVHWPEYGGLSYVDLVADWGKSSPGIVDIVDLNYDEFRFLPVPDPHQSGLGALQYRGARARPADRFGRSSYVSGSGVLRDGYPVPATILDCDVLISCPALKVHLASGTSLAIKNYVGTMAPSLQQRNFKNIAHDGDLERGFVDAFSYHPADYAILEGFWGTEGNGPQWGDDVQHNIVIASADSVAADAVGSAVMGYNAEDLMYLQLSARKGFGEMDLRHLQVVGRPIAEVQRLFRLGTGRSGITYNGRGVRNWLVAPVGDEPSPSGWTRVDSEDRYIDLTYHLGPGSPTRVWAYTEIECERSLTLETWLGSDGPAAVYYGREQVLALSPADGHHLGEARYKLTLPAGRSGLLLRATKGGNALGFSLLLCGQPGCLPLGVHYLSPGEAEASAAVEACQSCPPDLL